VGSMPVVALHKMLIKLTPDRLGRRLPAADGRGVHADNRVYTALQVQIHFNHVIFF
jgi:hypothetical protein